ncbi:FadR/GntR family transcriptional regulator [Amycolatopsis acidicola]|uniref:FadR/GntR family transcriptional regulator n=1 Tax=Amycolatopsis acidicola TaxID=2596893 RepID=UPI001FB68ECB|nr:FCD domain-containing protein [Amycolatopsis acidicola]
MADIVADRILQMITSEQLRPGAQLPPERELASLLGTSRPSLREALRSLQARGYVDIRHGTGAFVLDPATARTLREAMFAEEMSLVELFDMREVLELPAAGWAAVKQDELRLARVREAFEAVDEASSEELARSEIDWRRMQRLDAAFHLSIVQAAGNRFMSQSVTVLQDILARGMETTLRIPGRLARSQADHRRILDAVMAGDPTASRRAVASHIRGARKAAFTRIREQGGVPGD